MLGKLLDVWDVKTFDDELLGELRPNAQLIRDYLETDYRIFIEREKSTHRGMYQENPYGGHYYWLKEHIQDYMRSRTIRTWHYTRLTNDEISRIQQFGFQTSSLDMLRKRLDARVAAGDFSKVIANALFDASPLHEPSQYESRLNQFWMTSHPIQCDDSLVTLLLGNWGGESVYFWLEDEKLEKIVSSLGMPRIIEVALPISFTTSSYSAAEAVIGAFARSIGCKPDREAFDLYSNREIGKEYLLAIHTSGETKFEKVGRDYPSEFKRYQLQIDAGVR